MATLLFSAIGTAVGGPLGGVLGALVGQQVDKAIIGGGSVSGPRLKELEVTTSSYGAALSRHYGRMRVPGSIIWSTDLQEASETQGGKGQPDVTTYNYSVSLAVALASRPISGIGRIWADGKLLRGEAGDLKAGGTMRIYTGEADQDPDPLIASVEGQNRCPAYRGLAYVVFEDLDLSEFYNRLPALTFEVIADNGFSLGSIVAEIVDDVDADLPLDGLDGFSCNGPLADTLRQLDPMYPIDADANGPQIILARERLQTAPIALPEAAISVADGDFGGMSGYARRRLPLRERPPEILRYYDIDRDYLPGLQRSAGRPGPGQPNTVELAASMSAANARILVEQTKQKADWSRDRLSWRSTQLDPAVAPGSIVTVPGHLGRWRVDEWEWRETGVEMSLERVVPTGADQTPPGPVDPGRINPVEDLPAPPTSLMAFELPWDGNGSSDTPQILAAVSSNASNWSGAALFVDDGSGALQSLGASGRTRSIMGSAVDVLAATNPLLFDRHNTVTVELIADDMNLANATSAQLAAGWNKALLGTEILQFALAEPLGNRQWRVSGLLRGRGGTENALDSHLSGENFVLLDSKPKLLDAALVGTIPGTQITAAGRGDPEPVSSAIALKGATLRPLSPVHPQADALQDGSLKLSWTRRARGAWAWPDGIETPLREEFEQYLVTYGPIDAPIAAWNPGSTSLLLSAQDIVDLQSALPAGAFHVRQQGSFAISDPLLITALP
ncbi:MAG: phage tail protein [Sphingomonadaceae bacterium]|nr:phage tail protein [Sphingomonadaceae bacterium]